MAGRCAACGTPTTPAEIIQIICRSGICPGQGLECTGECIRVALSPGGGIELDPFGRLRVNCCDGADPQPGACVATIDQLGEFVTGGNYGGAGLLHPYGSPQAIEYALDHGLDMIVNDVWSTEDGIAVWSVSPPQVALNSYTTSPTSAAGLGVTSSDWVSLRVDAGTAANPTGRGAYAPAVHKDPDGGWYGWYAPEYHPQTFANVLRGLSQRVVTWADIAYIAGDDDFNERSVVASIRAVSTACTHESTILAVHPDMISVIPQIVNAQITPAVYVPGNLTPDPDAVAAAGAEWVRVANLGASLADWVATGMQVVSRTTSRHVDTQRIMDAGARGIHVADPVYARYPADPGIWGYYRRGQVSYVRRQTELGHLTEGTDDLSILGGRPFTKSTEYGLYVWATADERPRNTVLIGEVCPLPSPVEDSYTWECQVDEPGGPLPDGVAPKIGVNICQTTDRDTTPVTEDGQYDGYTAFIRVGTVNTGQLEIGKFTPGQPYQMLAQSTVSQPVPPNEWMIFRLEVTATDITLTRTDVATPYSVTATDSDYRGPYVSWLVNTSAEDGTFTAGVRQFVVASVAGPDDEGIDIGAVERA